MPFYDLDEPEPLLRHYRHSACNSVTEVEAEVAIAYREEPDMYDGAFCDQCKNTFLIEQFEWITAEEALEDKQ